MQPLGDFFRRARGMAEEVHSPLLPGKAEFVGNQGALGDSEAHKVAIAEFCLMRFVGGGRLAWWWPQKACQLRAGLWGGQAYLVKVKKLGEKGN